MPFLLSRVEEAIPLWCATLLNWCAVFSPVLSFEVFLCFRGTVEDTELVDGLVLEQKISHSAGGVTSVEKAKIGLIQFCLSPPKTDVSH